MKRIFVILMFGLAMTAKSQAVASLQNQGNAKTAEPRISVAFESTPLDEAIRTIAQRSGMRIMFSASLMPARRVTYHGDDVTVSAALTAVLRETGMSVERTVDGSVKLIAGKVVRSLKGQGVITGKVTDAKSGKSVSGANISVDTDNRGVISDENGSYRITGISAGSHTVTVRLVGYAKQTRSVTVGEGAIIAVDFKLEPSASVLNDVIVTGTIISTELKVVPNAITVITAKQIEERGITRIDQLFRGEIPGLFSLNRGSEVQLDEVAMFSRGATALMSEGAGGSAGTSGGTNPIKTYIDGVEMADSKYLSQIDPKSIERIEILTGPQASTIYGANAINGVMQIFTKRGSTSRPQLSLSLSSGVAQNNFNSHLAPSHIADASISGVEGKVSYNIGGSWNYIGAWTPSRQTQRLSGNGGGRMEWGKATTDVSIRSGLTQNRQHGSLTQGATDFRSTGVWVYSAASDVVAPQIQSLNGRTLGLSLSFRPISWWSHDIGLGSDASTTETLVTAPSFGSRSDTSVSITPSTTSRVSQRYTTTMQLPLSGFARLNLIMGGDHWRTKGSEWQGRPLSLIGSFACFSTTSCTRDRPAKNSGAFVQGQFSISDALFFTYGVRADWNPNFGDKARVLPGRYGVSFTRDIGLVSVKLRGSYGRSIRPPADRRKSGIPVTNATTLSIFGPFYLTLPNSDLGPEFQQGGEGGIELYLGARGSLVITRYNQTVDNLISLVGSSSAPNGFGLDSIRSLNPNPTPATQCSSTFRDADGYCYRYQNQYLNVGSIRNQGWELTSSLNLGPLTTRGTYSWVKSRVLGVTPRYRSIVSSSVTDGDVFEAGRPFDFVPEHTWALGLTYAHSASSLSLSVNGIGMRYNNGNALVYTAIESSRLTDSRPRMDIPGYRSLGAGYVTADLNASHRFSSHMDAILQVANLTNYYQNDFSAQYAALGRQTRTGVRLRF